MTDPSPMKAGLSGNSLLHIPEWPAGALRRGERHVPFPFRIQIDPARDDAVCRSLVRIVPGRRLVALAEWKGQSVIAKLHFAPRRHGNHALREVRGHESLVRHGIATPRLLLHGTETGGKGDVLLYERLIQTIDLSQCLRHDPQCAWHDPPQAVPEKEILDEVMRIWADLHRKGGFHGDPHPGNLLVRRASVFVLDPASISWTRAAVGRSRSLRGLGTWFAQWETIDPDTVQSFCDVYAAQRGWTLHRRDRAMVLRHTAVARKRRIRRFLGKCFRDSTGFVSHSDRACSWVCCREVSGAWKDEIHGIDQRMEEGRPLKRGNTCTVVRATLCDMSLVVKRYNIKNRGHLLKRLLQSSRASRVWRMAQWLKFIGIPTPEPIGFAERLWLGRSTVSYYVSEFLPGDTLREYLCRPGLDASALGKTADQVCRLFHRMKEARLCQADLKADNLRVSGGRVYLLDLDSLRACRTSRGLARAWSGAWNRFMRNWEDRPDLERLFSGRMDTGHEDRVPLPAD